MKHVTEMFKVKDLKIFSILPQWEMLVHILMFLVLICAFIVLIAQIIIETDEM